AAVTVITGVLVFVGGQFIVKSAIEPYIEFKKQLGKISNLLLANQAKLANPCAVEMSEIIHELKDAAAQLMAKHSALPFYIKNSISDSALFHQRLKFFARRKI
ncbi:TPA: hypothetical protein JLS65_004310, partial [Escherichia coli]|nr:hypothetical protein [Escherichia coli]